MHEHSPKTFPFVTNIGPFVTTMGKAGLLALTLCVGVLVLAVDATAQMRDDPRNQDMMRLGDQLRDCRGDACVPIREEMMTRLRDQLQNCRGPQCDRISERLRLHEQVRDCHALRDRGCRELRMREREEVRPRFRYRDGTGGGMGMGRGPGRGMGQGMGGGN